MHVKSRSEAPGRGYLFITAASSSVQPVAPPLSGSLSLSKWLFGLLIGHSLPDTVDRARNSTGATRCHLKYHTRSFNFPSNEGIKCQEPKSEIVELFRVPRNLMILILQCPFAQQCALVRENDNRRMRHATCGDLTPIHKGTTIVRVTSHPAALLQRSRCFQRSECTERLGRDRRHSSNAHNALDDRNATSLTFEAIAARSRNCPNHCEAYPAGT